MWVYITGVTHHHQTSPLSRCNASMVGKCLVLACSLSANWRGSYCFIPTTRNEHLFSSLAVGAAPAPSVSA
ncbi:hypothetical protein ACNKHK_03055 [Shigella flexneri]